MSPFIPEIVFLETEESQTAQREQAFVHYINSGAINLFLFSFHDEGDQLPYSLP